MDTGSVVGVVVVITFLVTLLFIYQRSGDKLKMRVVKLEDDLKRCREEKDNAWSLLAEERKHTLKYLKLVAEGIIVSVGSLTKDSFFSNGPVKLYFWDNFRSWILSAIPDSIPAFSTTLSSFTLTRNMYDRDILTELGNPTPFTVSEFAAIMKGMLSKQPQGEPGDLLTDGYANIFYVKLDDGRVVAVLVHWYADYPEWNCYAHDFDNDRWSEGNQVFVRS